ncbi:MAG: hypothetical protein OSJ60_21950, partial [Lachnospiraceae bacterium]|nr:hypothetical protein [Lachnospiraceae bacterium]
IAGGLTNAVNGLIYGNGALQSLGEAAVKGAASGALTSGINYLADVTSPQPTARRSPGIQYQGGAVGMLRPRDPKRGCVPSDPSIGSLRYGRDYGYQYNVPVSNEDAQNRRGFSLWDFGKEVVLGAVTGGMAGATFYGAGRAVSALKESIGNRSRNDQIDVIETSRVGRWMSKEEYNKMVKTGYVQKPYNAEQSYVANPANYNAYYKQANKGSVYVEFDVPSSSLKQTKDMWAAIPGPDSIYSKLNVQKGLEPYAFPKATNIWLGGKK